MSRVVILQSAYIPWKGYFHLIHEADVFVFYDDVQFTHSDWRSRNRIMTATGPQWLTIPAGRDLTRLICDVEIRDGSWKRKHRRTIEQNYRRAPHFERQADLLDHLYGTDVTNLSELNQHATRQIASRLGISTTFRDSREFALRGGRTARLVDLARHLEADEYVSGPAGRNYLETQLFDEAGLRLSFFEYPEYPAYPQLYGPFTHEVSILDLLFNVGEEAPRYIWSSSTPDTTPRKDVP